MSTFYTLQHAAFEFDGDRALAAAKVECPEFAQGLDRRMTLNFILFTETGEGRGFHPSDSSWDITTAGHEEIQLLADCWNSLPNMELGFEAFFARGDEATPEQYMRYARKVIENAPNLKDVHIGTLYFKVPRALVEGDPPSESFWDESDQMRKLTEHDAYERHCAANDFRLASVYARVLRDKGRISQRDATSRYGKTGLDWVLPVELFGRETTDENLGALLLVAHLAGSKQTFGRRIGLSDYHGYPQHRALHALARYKPAAKAVA